MKKLSLSLLAMYLFFQSFGQFSDVGSATGSGGTYNLTPSATCGWQVGAIWCNGTAAALPQFIDFTHGFTLSWYGKITPGPYNAADGYCAVFGTHITTSSIGNSNAYLGYYDIQGGPYIGAFHTNSIGVEFDFFNNYYDPYLSDQDLTPYTDHTQISFDGDPGSGTPVAGPVPVFPSGATLKDGAFHYYVINWDCSAHIFSVYVDGVLRLSTNFDPVARFGSAAAATAVQWGFTAGTGAYCADQVLTQITLNNTYCCCPQMPCTCVQQTGGYYTGSGTWVDYQFNFTSCSPTATIYYECVNASGAPVCPGPFAVLPGGTLTLSYIQTFCSSAVGVCIVGVCDQGCCWGVTPSNPQGNPLLTCCAYANNKGSRESQSGVSQSGGNNMSLSLIPNPNVGSFVINGKVQNATATDAQMEVTDILGKPVFTDVVKVDNGTINKSIQLGANIPSGDYLLKIINKDGSQVIKFTISK